MSEQDWDSLVNPGMYGFIPNIPGLQDVPYLTYLQLFDNDHLPERLIVMGAGPIGIKGWAPVVIMNFLA